jgi:hypothetical protein
MIRDLEKKKVTVDFWLVAKEFNVQATTLANAAFAGMEDVADAEKKSKRPTIRMKRVVRKKKVADGNGES